MKYLQDECATWYPHQPVHYVRISTQKDSIFFLFLLCWKMMKRDFIGSWTITESQKNRVQIKMLICTCWVGKSVLIVCTLIFRLGIGCIMILLHSFLGMALNFIWICIVTICHLYVQQCTFFSMFYNHSAALLYWIYDEHID